MNVLKFGEQPALTGDSTPSQVPCGKGVETRRVLPLWGKGIVQTIKCYCVTVVKTIVV